MGDDLTYQVTNRFRVDVKEALSELSKLKKEAGDIRGAYEGAGKGIASALDSAFSTAKGTLGEVVKGLGAFGLAAEGAQKIAEGLEAAFDFAHLAGEMQNLEARVPVERLRKMQDATEGAVSKMDLMKFSLRAMSGELHLTASGMDVVLKAANTLGDQGFGDTMEIADKLTESLRRGTSRGLREFGIAIADTDDKQANLNKQLKEFQKLAEMDVEVDPVLKKVERAQAAWADFLNDIKTSLGQIVISIGEAVDSLLGLVPKSERQKTTEALSSAAQAYARGATGGLAPKQPGEEGYTESGADLAYGNVAQRMGYDPNIDKFTRNRQASLDYWVRYFQYIGKQNKRNVNTQAISDIVSQAFAQGGLTEGSFESEKKAPTGTQDYWEKLFKGGPTSVHLMNKLNAETTLGWQRLVQYNDESDRAHAEENFKKVAFSGLDTLGPIEDKMEKEEEFVKKLQDQTTALGGAYSFMSSGLSAAVDAAITGSENIGKAAMKASAMALKSIALEATAKALFATAEGIFGFGPGLAAAGMYWAAAAAAGAGAAILGSASGAFSGGGGGGSMGVPGGGHATNGGSAPRGPEAQNVTVYVGDGFVGRPDELGKMIAEKVNQASKTGRASVVTTPSSVVTYRSG